MTGTMLCGFASGLMFFVGLGIGLWRGYLYGRKNVAS